MATQETLQNSDESLIKAVHDTYSNIAKSGADSEYSARVAKAFGYSPEELQSIPADSHMGLSCGNPTAAATIREGEHLLDLGSGGGMDILLAAAKVGAEGQAIGLDMSADMIDRARSNAAKQGLHPPRVAFVHAALTEPLPIASASIDCVISNCVVNLLPPAGKSSLLKEVSRVLKPGGRVVFDDIVAKAPLPDNIRNDLAAYVGCISGAIVVQEYKTLLTEAGLTDVVLVDTRSDLNIYFQSNTPGSSCCSPGPLPAPCCTGGVQSNPKFDANAWVASYQVYAIKPQTSTGPPTESKAPAPLLRWWDAYPITNSKPEPLTRAHVAQMLRDPTLEAGKDYTIVDVRRDDHAGGHVKGSVQHPAQSFYDDLPGFHEQYGSVKQVVFYCQSSQGRGPRCAAWYQDYLDKKSNANTKSYVLEGGIKAWLADPVLGDLVEVN